MHSQRSSTIFLMKKFLNKQSSSSLSTLCLNCKMIKNPKQTRYNLVNEKSNNNNNDYIINNKRNIMTMIINRQQTTTMDTTTMTQSDQIRCPFKQHHQKTTTNLNHRQQQQQQHEKNQIKFEKNYKSFEQIPTPAGLPIIGTLFDLIRAGGAEYVHQYCDKRHKQFGSIYREKLGNVEAVFVADAELVQQVYKHEGKYPQHMVPEPWIIYNQNKGIKRGLFFMYVFCL